MFSQFLALFLVARCFAMETIKGSKLATFQPILEEGDNGLEQLSTLKFPIDNQILASGSSSTEEKPLDYDHLTNPEVEAHPQSNIFQNQVHGSLTCAKRMISEKDSDITYPAAAEVLDQKSFIFQDKSAPSMEMQEKNKENVVIKEFESLISSLSCKKICEIFMYLGLSAFLYMFGRLLREFSPP